MDGVETVTYTKYSKLYGFSSARERDAYNTTFYPEGPSAHSGLIGLPSDSISTGATRYREPAVLVNNGSNGDDYKYSLINNRKNNQKFTEEEGINGLTNQFNLDYENMIISVEKYRGFYIGRYEITGSGEIGIERVGNVGLGENWYQLYNKCMSFDTENTESAMIYGTLWDATMKWLAENGIDVGYKADSMSGYGNYKTEEVSINDLKMKNKIIIKAKGEAKKLKTGETSFTKSNNIYDLSGNCYDWTQEANYNAYRVMRGGDYGALNYSASLCYTATRALQPANKTFTNLSARPFLYVKYRSSNRVISK